ncbi:P-loop containing nucleoside triphosphate hydrolase protein [Lepidopterella palustris CBS 459.81]|uniref:P-loop containing nucleoside triphosphate hydrolase protein n=1 Tax=Lepidopterella palustris CBS 459.81 TaxID=1314670 RepID=A0A8E2EJ14_9PEZI|nr:P-loop containing nucleoside triphosphate hydrolase protein [Lepidopterella palustris CBS 459.81]
MSEAPAIPRRPSRRSIDEVVRRCGCDENRALSLLRVSGGNCDEAVRFYKDEFPSEDDILQSFPPEPPAIGPGPRTGLVNAQTTEIGGPPRTHPGGQDPTLPDHNSRPSSRPHPDHPNTPGTYPPSPPQDPGDASKPAENAPILPDIALLTPPDSISPSPPPPEHTDSPHVPEQPASDGLGDGITTVDEKGSVPLQNPDSPDGIGENKIRPVPALNNEETVPPVVAPKEGLDHEKQPEEAQEIQPLEWDFVLPIIHAPPELTPGGSESSGTYFSMRDLVGAMQHGASADKIRDYFGFYDRKTVARYINQSIEGFPAMFYAVATNNDWIIRTWIGYGGDVDATYGPSKVPLLAFAVINSDNIQNETTLTIATLLSFGAKSTVIPKKFYSPFCEDLPDEGPDEEDMEDLGDKNKRWCTPSARAKLARTLNLTQRYYLEKSIKTKKPSIRHRQVALRRQAEALLGIHYFLIGQTYAATSLMQKLLSFMMLPSKRPLVLVFAGPSGHGKTELARQLGNLLSLELQVVDCTIFNRETELFGPRAPFTGSERGSPLNNFLARKAGEQCVVFLDEFEKTTADIHNALLIAFDKGEGCREYQDRRHLTTVDCSKTLWILATNALDPTIKEFCRRNEKAIFFDEDPSQMSKLMKSLEKQLKTEFKEKFDAPLTGRISSFLPFLPFSPSEQAVVAHKYILELAHRVRPSVNLSYGPEERLLGNVFLRVRRDASVCKAVAAEGYDADLGARSLITTVKADIEGPVVLGYLEVDEEIIEGQDMQEYLVDMSGTGSFEVTRVRRKGRADEEESESGSEGDWEGDSDGS